MPEGTNTRTGGNPASPDAPMHAHRTSAPVGDVREGWKMVPVEPSEVMLDAMEKEQGDCQGYEREAAIAQWRAAMLAASPAPESVTGSDERAREDSWANTPNDVWQSALLLAEVELHLQSCRVFLTSREKMHPCGVDLHDELHAKVTAAMDAIGREKSRG